MKSEDLKLNELHRFAKHSPRLVLEEHSHCEIPAGCGGVVLRWRSLDEGFHVVLHAFGGSFTSDFLDGEEIRNPAFRLPMADTFSLSTCTRFLRRKARSVAFWRDRIPSRL